VGPEPTALIDWVGRNKKSLDGQLLDHGAVLFRGFDFRTADTFSQLACAICGDLANYVGGTSPRTQVGSGVYTTTEYPPQLSITLHNEMAYATKWPMRILFFCLQPAAAKGETPIADSRKVLERLTATNPSVVDRFRRKRLMFVQNNANGVGYGKSWQSTYCTDDRRVVESFCAENDIGVEWLPDGRLRTKMVRDAVARHPTTGELVWFNHADFFHPSSLPSAIRSMMLAQLKDEGEFPHNVYFGDGSPIPEEDLGAIRNVKADLTVVFPWVQGDVLLLDNMLAAHGRAPFTGPRRILCAMGDECPRSKASVA
jgi:alpha-ketoglutarate-dependent taurine dioxygenase